MKLQLTKGSSTGEKAITESELASICVEVCGGGWSTAQTAAAMRMQSQLYAGQTVKKQGVTLQLITDGDTD